MIYRFLSVVLFSFCFWLSAPFEAMAEEVENVCIECHSGMDDPPRLKGIVEHWKKSIHGQNGVKCNNCHGGDPTDYILAMDPEAGFRGKPTHQATPAFCGRCHIGVYDNYKVSAHQKALSEGKNAPTCVSCHTNHDVVKVTGSMMSEEKCGNASCHPYAKVKYVKEAFTNIEKRLAQLEAKLPKLDKEEMKTSDIKEEIFASRQSLHALTHTLSQQKIGEKMKKTGETLTEIEQKLQDFDKEVQFRKMLGIFLIAGSFLWLLIFARMRRIARSKK